MTTSVDPLSAVRRAIGDGGGIPNILVWRGTGTIGAVQVRGGQPDADDFTLAVALADPDVDVELATTVNGNIDITRAMGPDHFQE